MKGINEELVPLGVRIMNGNGRKGVTGGYFVWLELPEGVDASVVSTRAIKKEEDGGQDLVVAQGGLFEVVGDKRLSFEKGIRLCFAWVEEGDLREGVRRLGRVMRDVLEEKGGAGEGGVEGGRVQEDLGDLK